MPSFPSSQEFSAAAVSLYSASPLCRTSIKYRVDGGLKPSVLTLRVTDNAKTLTYSGRTRADLSSMDKLSKLALDSCFSAAAGAAAAASAGGGGGGGSSGASAPKPPPAGSGAQRRNAARAAAASAGAPAKAPRVKKSRQRARERARVRREERKLAAGAGGGLAP